MNALFEDTVKSFNLTGKAVKAVSQKKQTRQGEGTVCML